MYMVYNNFIKAHGKLFQILGSFFVGLLLGLAIISLLSCFNVIDLNPKQYAYIDVEKVIESVNNSLNDQTKTNNISENEVREKLTLAKNKFDSLLKDYVRQHNAIIFTSVKAIAGVKNETDYFIEQMLMDIK